MIFMLILAIAMALFYIICELTQKPLVSLFIKALASLSFIALGMTTILLDQQVISPVVGWVLLGLASGLIGDLILALRPLRPKEEDRLIIVFGIIAFSIGHLFYLTALFTLMPFSWIALIMGLAFLIIVIVMSDVMKFDMKIARFPSYMYAFLIFFMVGQSFAVAQTYDFSTFSLLFLIGALLFAISDLILAPIYYTNLNSKMMIAINLTAYYGAQILIALSLYLM